MNTQAINSTKHALIHAKAALRDIRALVDDLQSDLDAGDVEATTAYVDIIESQLRLVRGHMDERDAYDWAEGAISEIADQLGVEEH